MKLILWRINYCSMGKNKIISILTVFLCFILFVALKPGDNPVILVRIASLVAAIVFVSVILYTRVLWRVSPFNKLHKVIDVGGKWKGHVSLDDGDYCQVEAHITQYLDDVRIKIKTNDFLNDSLVCKMNVDNQGAKLYAVYKAKPSGRVDSKCQIEYGTFIINCDEDFLEGLFFTSNKSMGRLELYRK